jgi:hypothetical protein
MSMVDGSTRARLERKRRRASERELRLSPLWTVRTPSLAWITPANTVGGLASLLDVPGCTLWIDRRRFAPAADGIALAQDFRAIAADMRLTAETAIEKAGQQRLFDVSDL